MSQIALEARQGGGTWQESAAGASRYLVPVGRLLFAAIFIFAAFGHFSKAEIDMAAAAGVPFAGLVVPFSGIMALVGGLSILVGYHACLGALVVVAFLVPVTLMMHKFWTVTDPMMKMIDMVMFMKNTALIGAALLIAHFGAGPLSLDSRRGR
jgi:putative oxidoreductase